MTKQEYLDKLQAALGEKVPELMQEVMEDYEVHFAFGLKNGKTEEQICEELGDIEEFVEELAQMESSQKAAKQSQTTEQATDTDTDEDVEHCHGKVEGKGAGQGFDWDDIQHTVNKAINSVQEFINQKNVQDLIYKGEEAIYQGSAVIHEKVREYFRGPAFENDSSAEETNEKAEGADTVKESETKESGMKNLVLEGLSANVLVEPSVDGRFHIDYQNYGSLKQQMQYRFYFREENDTIYTGVRKSKTAAGVFWENFSPTMELVVKLPVTAERVEIRTNSGDISMRGVTAKELRIGTSNGDQKIYRIKAEAMRASSISGDIQADQMDVTFLEIQTKSGDVNADDVKGEAILFRSTSGDVTVSHVDCRELSMSSISGDATGRGVQADQMACTSTSGDSEIQGNFIRCRVESVSGDATLTAGRDLDASVSSVSGDVELCLNNGGRGFELTYQTVSGELEVRYGNEHQHLTRKGQLQYGEKGSRIYFKTVSGDMKISG